MEGMFDSGIVSCMAALFLLSSLPVLASAQGSTTPTPNEAQTTNKDQKNPNHLVVKVLPEKPFVMKSLEDPTRYEGLLIDILNNITGAANYNYDIHPVYEDRYGYEHTPGNWTGLIGSLQSGVADLAIAPITILSKRQTVVDFTLPIMSSGLRILYKPSNPWTDSESFFLVLKPFTAGMWVLLLLMFVAVSVLFYLIGRFSPYEDHAFVGKAATYEGLTFRNSFLYVFSAFTFQGYTAAPRSLSGRVLAAVWWLFVLLVVASYTASLCAVILAFKPSLTSLPFATFDELSQQSHVAYGILQGGMTERYLKNSKRPLERRLWGTITAHAEAVNVQSVTEGVSRVRATPGSYAFITEGPIAEHISEQPPCDLMTLGEPLNRHSWGFACRKGTGVCSKLNTAILALQETDAIFDLKKKWLHQGCNRDDTAEYIYQGMSYIDTFGSTPKYYADRAFTLRRFGMGFLCLVIGMSLSACLLLAEIFFAKRRGMPVPQRMPGGMGDQDRIDREFRDDDTWTGQN